MNSGDTVSRALLFLKHVQTHNQFDNSYWGCIFDAPICVPTTPSGLALQDARHDRIASFFSQGENCRLLTSALFQSSFAPERGDMSLSARMSNGGALDLSEATLVIVSVIWFYYGYISFLREHLPNAIIIGLEEESLQEVLLEDTALHTQLLDAFGAMDAYICQTQDMYRWCKHLTPRAVYTHHPVPLHLLGLSDVPSLPPTTGHICAGIGTFNSDMANFLSSIQVYQLLQSSRSESLTASIVGVPEFRIEEMRLWERRVQGLQVLGLLGDSYYRYLSSCEMILQLTTRATSGRVSAECAVLGIPVIGNAQCDLQKHCWPELSISPYDIAGAYELAIRLSSDPEFRTQCCVTARDRVEEIMCLADYRQFASNLLQTVTQER